MFPSGPGAIASGLETPGDPYWDSTPDVVIRAIESLPPPIVNHSAPSGPAAISSGQSIRGPPSFARSGGSGDGSLLRPPGDTPLGAPGLPATPDGAPPPPPPPPPGPGPPATRPGAAAVGSPLPSGAPLAAA